MVMIANLVYCYQIEQSGYRKILIKILQKLKNLMKAKKNIEKVKKIEYI